MGTLKGFPSPPALWLRQAEPAFANAIMGTLKGFPSPPALWLRQAEPAFANAIMGALERPTRETGRGFGWLVPAGTTAF